MPTDEDKTEEAPVAAASEAPPNIVEEMAKQAQAQPTAAEKAAAQNELDKFMDTFAASAMSCIVKGAVVSLPQIPPVVVVKAMARQLGIIIGTSFNGGLSDVLLARKVCREAFIDGLAKCPLPAAGPSMPVKPNGLRR